VANHAFGKAFVATPTVALGVTNLDSFQSGQWVQVLGQPGKARFIRERKTGQNFILNRPKGSRLSMSALRLVAGVAKPDVVKVVK
jgi:hypothetical protein